MGDDRDEGEEEQAPATNGELVRLREFLRRRARGLLRCPEEIEDAVQEALVHVWIRPPPTEAALTGWAGGVLRNVTRHARRSRSRRRRHEGLAPVGSCLVDDPLDLLVTHEARERVLRALTDLPPNFRHAVRCRYFVGLPPQDIAREDGIPVATVKSRLARAKRRLEEALTASA